MSVEKWIIFFYVEYVIILRKWRATWIRKLTPAISLFFPVNTSDTQETVCVFHGAISSPKKTWLSWDNNVKMNDSLNKSCSEMPFKFKFKFKFISFLTEHKWTRYMQMKWQYIEIIQNNYMHITSNVTFKIMFDTKMERPPKKQCL